MRKLTPRQVMIPAVLLMTAAHLGLRLNARNDAQPLDVSLLEPGSAVSLAGLAEVTSVEPSTCYQLVVFSPDCPFCQRAADREAEELTDASRSSRLWFTDAETSTLPYFVSEHLRRDPSISAKLVEALKIQAVPALFVISPEGQVRWVGGYNGNETDEELIDRCNGNQSQRT
jgi:hypothetical protein